MKDTVEEAREVALRHLERRRRTRWELERRLRERHFSPEIVQETLARLERVGLVDDREYARAYLRERLSRRAVGVQVMRRQLMERGVSGEVIDRAVDEMSGGAAAISETDRCRKALQKLLPRYSELDPTVRRRRMTAALSRRGFGFGLITELLREMEQQETGL